MALGLPNIKLWAAIIAVVAFLILEGLIVFAAYRWGASGVKADQAINQLKENNNVGKTYARIDRTLPSDADLPGIAGFLLQRIAAR